MSIKDFILKIIMNNNTKFEYGYDIGAYLAKAIDKIKKTRNYYWVDLSQFSKQYRYAIEEEMNEYHYIRYIDFTDETVREVLDVSPFNEWDRVNNADDFIRLIVTDNETHVYAANKKIKCYKVNFEQGLDIGGWYLERYEFLRHESGDYSVFVQAGDRSTGGSRYFFIPPDFLKGTYEEFLDKHETLVPGKEFGLYKKDLINDTGLKEFLGFGE